MSTLSWYFSGLAQIEKKLAPLSASQLQAIDAQMQSWLHSDFAGFRRILEPAGPETPDLLAIQNAVKKHRQGATGKIIQRLVVLGTGGSSLGAETIANALVHAGSSPELVVCDNNDPAHFSEALAAWQAESTAFFVVSKSGSTPETLSQFLVARDWLQRKLPAGSDWQQHVILCTDPQAGDLRALALSQAFTCLDLPTTVGGRFSVLTPVGLFPAAFAGLRVDGFLQGARALALSLEARPLAENAALQLARALVADKEKNITVLMAYSSHLRAFSRWFCQLWAESLGKSGKGFTPFPALGTVDQHSQVQLYMEGPKDKIVGFLTVQKRAQVLPLPAWPETSQLPAFQYLQGISMEQLFCAEQIATQAALQQIGVPTFNIELEALSEESLGALFYWWQLVTAFAGAVLEVNPFDQPGVELGKKLTKQYLQKQWAN